MTRFTKEQIKTIKSDIVGKKVTEFYYDDEDDYFVMTFEDGSETSFRFMADLITPKL